jgi:acetyl-CoA carboxylase biotin carboxyl carrier protein
LTAPAPTNGVDRIELLVELRGPTIGLLSPEVGVFTEARAAGDLLAPGTEAGVLLALGRALRLVVPAGVEGRVEKSPPARTRQPVGWGDLLYEIRPGAASETPATAGARGAAAVTAPPGSGPAEASARLLVRSPQSGRLYLRPAPGEAPFVAPGTRVEQGQPIGLIEVMKTFAHVRYGGEGLPARARVTRVLVEDGAEVGVGDPLLEVEPDLLPGPSSRTT